MEWVKKRAMGMIRSLENKTYEANLGMFSMVKRRLRRDMIVAF